MTEVKNDKLEKIKKVYTRGMVALDVVKFKNMPEDIETAKELYNEIVQEKFYLIDDLSEPYLIRLAYTENKSKLKSVDPYRMNDSDLFELGESIQEILKENDFPINKSEFPTDPNKKDA